MRFSQAALLSPAFRLAHNLKRLRSTPCDSCDCTNGSDPRWPPGVIEVMGRPYKTVTVWPCPPCLYVSSWQLLGRNHPLLLSLSLFLHSLSPSLSPSSHSLTLPLSILSLSHPPSLHPLSLTLPLSILSLTLSPSLSPYFLSHPPSLHPLSLPLPLSPSSLPLPLFLPLSQGRRRLCENPPASYLFPTGKQPGAES